MQQLIQITSNPGKFELEIERGSVEYQNNHIPQSKVNTTPSVMKLDPSLPQVRLDSYQARKSLGQFNNNDFALENTRKAQNQYEAYVSSVVQLGHGMASIEDGTTIGSLMRQKVLEQPTTITMFLPSGGVDVSWNIGELETEYTPAETNIEWNIPDFSLEYTPGSISMKMLERPSVNIEYIGGPIYFPRSASEAYKQAASM